MPERRVSWTQNEHTRNTVAMNGNRNSRAVAARAENPTPLRSLDDLLSRVGRPCAHYWQPSSVICTVPYRSLERVLSLLRTAESKDEYESISTITCSQRDAPLRHSRAAPAEVRQMTGQGRRRAEGRGSTAVELLGRGGWRHRYWKNAGHTPTGRRFHPCLVHQRKSVLRGLSGSTGREHDRGVELRSTVS